jgi:hypothetical protein
VLGQLTFSDYGLAVTSGCSVFAPNENCGEAATILNSLLEQIRYEKGGTAGAYSPIRVYIEGDEKGVREVLFDECLVEEALDKNIEFPY